MAISKVENPADGSELTIVKGVVQQLSVKEIENDRYQNTHKFGVRVDDDWVNNITVKTKDGYDPQIRYNNGSQAKPDWQTLEVGDEVRLVVTTNEYNGKTYYNGGTSKIKLVKKGQGKASNSSSGAGKAQGNSSASSNGQKTSQGSPSSYKKDMTGVQVGHSINAAMNLLKDKPKNNDHLIETAQQLHDVSEKVKASYSKEHPNLSEYDVGAGSGNAVLNACKIAKKVEEVEALALGLLETVVPAVSAYVKDETKKEAVVEEESYSDTLDEFDPEQLPF